MQLINKIQISGLITIETGMHIGGSEVELKIGGIDNAVVKDSKTGIPYIPGSSLKGKLRDLIGRKMGYADLANDIGVTFILFGDGAKENHRNTGHLIVRDAFYNGDSFNFETGLEEKSENTINRTTGAANPRIMERAVRGASFVIDMVLDVYDKYNVKYATTTDNRLQTKGLYQDKSIALEQILKTLRLGFRLLENDYLGGSGTRGYGKVSLEFEAPQQIDFNEDGTITVSNIDFDFNLKADESN